MSTVVNMREAKTHLSRILDAVAAGADVVIARAGKPVARLVPIEQVPKPKQLGLLRGRIKVPADFNLPLRADVVADFEDRLIRSR